MSSEDYILVHYDMKMKLIYLTGECGVGNSNQMIDLLLVFNKFK